MADIRLVKFSAPIAGDKDINFADVAEGFSIGRVGNRPTSPIRTQNGTLINQVVFFDKKSISISATCLTTTLIAYFQSIWAINETVTLTTYKHTNNETEQTDKVYVTKMVAPFEDSNDFISATRTFGVKLEEI